MEWTRICVYLMLSGFLIGCRPRHPSTGGSWPSLAIGAEDRILVLAPHPDDEVIGCAGVIQKAIRLGVPVHIVFLTYGDNNQWSFAVYRGTPVLAPSRVRAMGEVRHAEAVEAARRLGVPKAQLTFLGYPDFGTFAIWTAHWAPSPAFRSMLTRVTAVPYNDAFRKGAAYKGDNILQDLSSILREFRPTKILVSHPADHHPDHQALYLFATIAVWNTADEFAPDLLPYLVHHPKWPEPRGDHPSVALRPPSSLTGQIPWCNNALTPDEVECKATALKAHRTQFGYDARYLLSFVRRNELFGNFPDVVLTPGPANRSKLEFANTKPQPQDELTEEERATFVGVEERSVYLGDSGLTVDVGFSRPLTDATSLSLYVFGYRKDKPFGSMPKLHIKLGPTGYEVFDQLQRLPNTAVAVARTSHHVAVTIPAAALGHPQRILTSTRTYLGRVPLDWVSWRTLILPHPP